MRGMPLVGFELIFSLLALGSPSYAQEVTASTATVEELASAMGIRPYCGEIRFPQPMYTRMVATITDENGLQSEREVATAAAGTYWRMKVFVFEDAQSHKPQRLIFNLDQGGSVAGNASIEFPPNSTFSRVQMGKNADSFCTVSIPDSFNPRKDLLTISFRLEAQPDPFPHPEWSSSFIPVITEKPAP